MFAIRIFGKSSLVQKKIKRILLHQQDKVREVKRLSCGYAIQCRILREEFS
jgi:hypothetical protein